MRKLLLLCWLGWLVFSGCTGARRGYPTVDGPEAVDLARDTKGLVVKAGRDATTQDVYGIFAISLMPYREVLIRGRENQETFWAVGGPDSDCHIVYTESPDFFARRVSLKTTRIDGKQDREIFSRTGDPSKLVGEYLALSSRGNLVAFASDLTDVPMPGVLLKKGKLEIWNIESKKGKKLDIVLLNQPMSWFPDGEHLAYVELVQKSLVKPELLREDLGRYASWPSLPGTFILDLKTGNRSLLSLGWEPAVSPDGKAVLLDGLDGKGKLVDATSGKVREVWWKGRAWSRTVGLLNGDLVLYQAPPTTGTQPRYTKYGSFGAGVPLQSLKVARLDTNHFQTLVPYIDGRHRISFGVCESR